MRYRGTYVFFLKTLLYKYYTFTQIINYILVNTRLTDKLDEEIDTGTSWRKIPKIDLWSPEANFFPFANYNLLG